jgi:hypothetical protein
VSSRNIKWAESPTLPSRKIHINIHENGYSADEKYKYINECVAKCLENRQQGLREDSFDIFRDHCIQTQCRIYE